MILDQAGSKGTGVWTVQNATGLGVPATAIGEAVFARALSSSADHRDAVRRAFPDRPELPEAPDGIEDDDLGLRHPTLDEVFLTLSGTPATDDEPKEDPR